MRPRVALVLAVVACSGVPADGTTTDDAGLDTGVGSAAPCDGPGAIGWYDPETGTMLPSGAEIPIVQGPAGGFTVTLGVALAGVGEEVWWRGELHDPSGAIIGWTGKDDSASALTPWNVDLCVGNLPDVRIHIGPDPSEAIALIPVIDGTIVTATVWVSAISDSPKGVEGPPLGSLDILVEFDGP